jgi:hypothetical protein
MTVLTTLSPATSYGDLLTTTNSGTGLSATLKNLQDGLGNNSTILIATDKVNFLTTSGNTFQLQGVSLTATATEINSVCESNTFTGTDSVTVPIGTTAQRPGTPVNGMIRYNATTAKGEMYANNSWQDLTA